VNRLAAGYSLPFLLPCCEKANFPKLKTKHNTLKLLATPAGLVFLILLIESKTISSAAKKFYQR
jgi:hypothetical protein